MVIHTEIRKKFHNYLKTEKLTFGFKKVKLKNLVFY